MKTVVDTNVLIWDTVDPDKLTPPASNALVDSKVLFIPTIVLLEFEWALRKLNQLDKLIIVTRAIAKQRLPRSRQRPSLTPISPFRLQSVGYSFYSKKDF